MIGWGLFLLKIVCTFMTRPKVIWSILIIKLLKAITMEDTLITRFIRQGMIGLMSWFRLRLRVEGNSMMTGERIWWWIRLTSIADRSYPRSWKLFHKRSNYSKDLLVIFQLTVLNPHNTRCFYSSSTIWWSHLLQPKHHSSLSTKCSKVCSTTSTSHLEEMHPNR